MRKIKLAAAIIVLSAILLNPEPAVAAAQGAMRIWYASVAPALFPFLALMPMLTGRDACAAYEIAFSRIMRPLFGLPGSAAPAMIIGMISGSPGGALAVRRIAAESGMRIADAKRLALAICGASPAYLLMGVGRGLYHSDSLGIKLVLIQVGVQFLLLGLLRGSFDDEGIIEKTTLQDRQNSIHAAVESVLAICGYMVLFSVIAGVAANLVGKHIGAALLLAADLPSGLAILSTSEFAGKVLVQGAAIGFGGLCIAAQNMEALREIGVHWHEYAAIRFIAAALSALASVAVIKERAVSDGIYMGKPVFAYAVSLFFAAVATLPVLKLISKKSFLNKRNLPKGTA